MQKFILLFIFLAALSLSCPALAQPVSNNATEIDRQLQAAGGPQGGNLGMPEDPRLIVAFIIRAALDVLGIIFLVLMVYAGFLWMTAGGEEEKVTKAKSLIYRAILGLAIILAAYSITWFAFKIALGISDYPDYFDFSF